MQIRALLTVLFTLPAWLIQFMPGRQGRRWPEGIKGEGYGATEGLNGGRGDRIPGDTQVRPGCHRRCSGAGSAAAVPTVGFDREHSGGLRARGVTCVECNGADIVQTSPTVAQHMSTACNHSRVSALHLGERRHGDIVELRFGRANE